MNDPVCEKVVNILEIHGEGKLIVKMGVVTI